MDAFSEQAAVLRRAYHAGLTDKVGEIRATWDAVRKGDAHRQSAERLQLQLHRMKGTSASFGFIRVSHAAGAVEALTRRLAQMEGGIPPALERDVTAGIEALAASVGESAEQVKLVSPSLPSSGQVEVDLHKGVVCIFDEDSEHLSYLASQITQFGYAVEIHERTDSFASAENGRQPLGIVVDLKFCSSDKRFRTFNTQVLSAIPPTVPLIYISEKTDFDSRLRAVRAGGAAFFSKPVNIISLVEKLDTLSSGGAPVPLRILIVEDDPDLAAYYSLLLGSAGMQTSILTDPARVFSAMVDFNPDLILLDIYMPGVRGTEVAKAIRQNEAYFSTPIVFLSGETDTERQLKAMSTGSGDDFLTKPVKPEHLVASVATRAERMRIIRSFSERDSLTGLFNHTAAKEQLDIALERVRRAGGALAVAMLDIDDFKKINDTHGHLVGDRVILSLARLLQQRLRKVDVIGRYGGEEFIVIISGTALGDAVRIMEEIRASFQKIIHTGGKADFSATFSCGVASSDRFSDAHALVKNADLALYRAKHAGKNRIEQS